MLTVYGIETFYLEFFHPSNIVATVLTVYGIETPNNRAHIRRGFLRLQQFLPFTVLKQTLVFVAPSIHIHPVATVLTVHGIETLDSLRNLRKRKILKLQQCLPFTICAEGCETAEEQSDDEARTSQVFERSEDKTKVMGGIGLLFTVLKLPCVKSLS